MKSLLKVLVLVSLIVISRLDKQNWELTAKPVKVSPPSAYPLKAVDFSKTGNTSIQQLFISQN
ncbi:hypothetical protein [Adhaeribacter pallidiroseus]|uniref:Uncharacterized protein n=1 Tax=Adhaeribacter pallidiroseus TaxID=2072847 RepID=A0A369QN59_9BACT|nr:hypothetical protein [Adhaeribacter pallidiroseus]RDC66333.1 hypothetical protein AHMF7616_04964 [Adhaeribacter pallidiroseus]